MEKEIPPVRVKYLAKGWNGFGVTNGMYSRSYQSHEFDITGKDGNECLEKAREKGKDLFWDGQLEELYMNYENTNIYH